MLIEADNSQMDKGFWSTPHKLRSSECFLTIHAWNQGQLHEGHPQRGQALPQAEQFQPHGGAMLPGDLREEPVRRRDKERVVGKVTTDQRAAVRAVAKA